VARVERAVLDSGIPLGGAAQTSERTRALTEAGYRVLIHGFDVLMLKQQVAAFRSWA
jgi:hypothetical protein